MLKKKLHKAGFVITSFLLMAAASGKMDPVSFPVVSHDSLLKKETAYTDHAFDSTGLCICMPELSASQKENAPRVFLAEPARQFVTTHLQENGTYYGKIRQKSGPIFKMIEEIFSANAIPAELRYLAVVESKLDNRIVSSAGASGLWQLMPQAARSFGLRVNGKADERKNNYKSTVAAARCIRYLHNLFDDWLLTVAAYNAGPGRVQTAIKKSGSRDFWKLEKFLPAETRKHVRKFISVHYFFEGHGSLVTMSHEETSRHISAVEAFCGNNLNPDSLSLSRSAPLSR